MTGRNNKGINKNQKSKRMSKMRRKRRQLLFCLVFACVVLITIISCAGLYRYVSKYPKDEICKNVYIGNVDVSGMTRKEAKAVLEEHLKQDRTEMVTLKVGKESAEATLEELGLKYKNIDKLTKQAVDYGKKGGLWSRYRKLRRLSKGKLVLSENFVLDEEESKAVLNERAVPLTEHAEDAQISKEGDGFTYKEEKEGKTVDMKKSIAGLETYLNEEWQHKDLSFELILKKELPKVTKEDLATIEDELGSFSTDAGGGDRWQNLKTGVDHLNGTVLMPGEEISVANATGPYDAEHGYTEAGSYENGQVVDSFGGGICQVSTTLYNAVLYAELEVEERYPHSMLVSYVEPSRDAAIATGILDFVFKNNYDTPIYIFAEIDGANQMRFVIYGKDTRKEGRTIEFESETLTTEEYGVTYKENAEAALGSVQYSGSPHTGKTAQLWKVVYQDGEEVSRDVINHSTYSKSDQIIEIGTKSENAQASSLVREAIASQDKAAIDAAISKAQSLGSGQPSESESTGSAEESSGESGGES